MALTKRAKKFAGMLAFVAVAVGGSYWVYTHQDILQQQQQKKEQPQLDVQQPQLTAATAAPQIKPAADAYASITQNHVIRVSVENPSKPIYWDDQGVVHGFNYEFLQMLMKQPEFSKSGSVQIDTAHHEVATYADVPKQLLVSENGVPSVDIAMDGLTYDDGTPSGVMYSNPYVDDFGYALVVRQDSSVKSVADLNGLTVGILKGDNDVKAYVKRQIPGATFVQIDDSDPDFLIKALDSKRVDAFVYDYPFAVPFVNGSDLKFAVSKLDGSDISYKIGVRASDTQLQLELNSAIGRVKSTQAYADLIRKYFMSSQIAATAASSGERTYIVKKGDTLALIAGSTLGSTMAYSKIQKRNNLPNPNLIQVGQKLVIPQA